MGIPESDLEYPPLKESFYPTIYKRCEDCDLNYCGEAFFGEYCVAATKRYVMKNNISTSLRGGTFLTHYNRRLDVYTLEEEGELRPEKIKSVPLCMKKSSLKYALEWTQYHLERNELHCRAYGKTHVKRPRRAVVASVVSRKC